MGYRTRRIGWLTRLTLHEFVCFRRGEKRYRINKIRVSGDELTLVRHNKCGKWWIR